MSKKNNSWEDRLYTILGGERYDLTAEEWLNSNDDKAIEKMAGFKRVYNDVSELIQAELDKRDEELIEELEKIPSQFDATKTKEGYAFPEHPESELRKRENYAIFLVLEAIDEAIEKIKKLGD